MDENREKEVLEAFNNLYAALDKMGIKKVLIVVDVTREDNTQQLSIHKTGFREIEIPYLYMRIGPVLLDVFAQYVTDNEDFINQFVSKNPWDEL